MYDLMGSLSVFGFLTAYALVALALPFARRALGQHSHLLAATSVSAVVVVVLIAAFDLDSTADAVHGRIPYLYLVYIVVGLAWYGLRRPKTEISARLWKTRPFSGLRAQNPYVEIMLLLLICA